MISDLIKKPVYDILTYKNFNPKVIPWQYRALWNIQKADYSKGVHEFLLSGSVGSAKSTLLAHIIVDHCLRYKRGKVGIGRESKLDLEETLYNEILGHMEGFLTEGVHYRINGKKHIIFKNKTRIVPFSWHDKRYKKFRSHAFSLFVIEELTENKTRDFYDEIKMRLGRMKHIPFAAIISATNPDDPAHWAYEYFIEGAKTNPKIQVFFSVTAQNPTLSKNYINDIRATLDPRMARRMLNGEWISLTKDKIYYSYDDVENVIDSYEIDPDYPIGMAWDFNIGDGKPMSMCLFQRIKGVYYFFDEVVIQTARTGDIMDELASRGYFDKGYHFLIYGDAAGKSNDTRTIKTDYKIIKDFMDNYEAPEGSLTKEIKGKVTWEYKVPLANPPIRTRHNVVNGLLCSDTKERRLFVAKKCTTIRKGLQLTSLKEGADYLEDDSKPYQHVTTAIGYAAVKDRKDELNKQSVVRRVT